jgi:hypothetical protein
MAAPKTIPSNAEFYAAVHRLRALSPRWKLIALYAAEHWSNERLDVAEANGDVPGCPGELVPDGRSVQ